MVYPGYNGCLQSVLNNSNCYHFKNGREKRWRTDGGLEGKGHRKRRTVVGGGAWVGR